MENELCLYDQNFDLLNSYETFTNPRGAFGYFPKEKSFVYPYKSTQGSITYISMLNSVNISKESHQNPIGLITFSPSGKLICTVSEGGTVLNIYKTENVELIKRVRRGVKNKVISHISFSHDENIFCSTSEGKVHLFSMKSEENSKSYLSSFGLGYVFDFVNEEKGFTEFEIANEGELIVKFDEKETYLLHVLTQSGNFYMMKYDKEKNLWDQKKQNFFKIE